MKYIKITINLIIATVLALTSIVIFNTWQLSNRNQANIPDIVASNLTFNEKTALKHFAESITFKTISSETEAINGDQFTTFHQFLKKTFPLTFSQLSVEIIGHHGLLLKWPGKDNAKQPVLYLAHQDVVPISPGTEKNWSHPPFAGEIADNYIWGRGTLDCKASLMALLEATEVLLSQHFTPVRTIYFYFGDDEESGGRTAAQASAWLKEKHIHFETVIDEGGIIANGLFPDINKSIAMIGIGEKGYLNLELSADAAGGHSSLPPKTTAIGEVSAAIDKLDQHPFPTHIHGITKTFLENLSLALPFSKRILFANTWLFEPVLLPALQDSVGMSAMLHTTEAPTIFNAGTKSNVLPIHATAIMNFRIDPTESINSVTAHVNAAINNPNIHIKALLAWEPSPVSSTDSRGYALLLGAIKHTFGNDLLITPFLVTGATDSRQFIAIADNVYRFNPNVVLSKSDLSRFHGTDERVGVEDYRKTLRFYGDLLWNS